MSEKLKVYSPEMLRAAYALNLCTVSVSQMVQYNDEYILDQEYESILNNLNLHNMPSDDALLKILTEILNTATFFKIQKIKKQKIEKKYQQEINNAIWSAVPSFSIIMSPDPGTIALALATQIGTGYMNYRRAKVEASDKMEDAELELEITAIEQLDALKRELFTTAWRLTETYNIDDELRLSEKQITRYNEILMDTNLIRRYERMDAIKDYFMAYPPFWFYFGDTASRIFKLDTEKFTEYKNKALDAFNYYWECEKNDLGLLRENQVAAACALEHAELLDANYSKDVKEIIELLKIACKYAPEEYDVLQICAVNYYKLGYIDEAADLLSRLVNEQYNEVLNAQLLSSIYVNMYLKGLPSAKNSYERLCMKTAPDYLLELPETMDVKISDLENSFIDKQRLFLIDSYKQVLDLFVDKYIEKISRKWCCFDLEKRYSNNYFYSEGAEEKTQETARLHKHKTLNSRYGDYLAQADFLSQSFSDINDFYSGLLSLYGVNDEHRVYTLMREILKGSEKEFESINKKLNENHDEGRLSQEDLDFIVSLTSKSFYQLIIEELNEQIERSVLAINNMEQISIAEQGLFEFCINNDLNIDNSFAELNSRQDQANPVFTLNMLLSNDVSSEMDIAICDAIIGVVKNNEANIIGGEEKKEFIYKGDAGFENYITKHNLYHKNRAIASRTTVIYHDKDISHQNYLLTTEGFIPFFNGTLGKLIKYSDAYKKDKHGKYTLELMIKSMYTSPLGPAIPAYAYGIVANRSIKDFQKRLASLFAEIDETIKKLS